MRLELYERAIRRTRVLSWAGLGLMGLQFGFLARLTWWEYSWDIMEPVTYFVTCGTAMAMYAYHVLTTQVGTFNCRQNHAIQYNTIHCNATVFDIALPPKSFVNEHKTGR